MKNLKLITLILMLFISGLVKSQSVTTDNISLVEYWNKSGQKDEVKYSKFIQSDHGFETPVFIEWKKENKILYMKEVWYYSESFYIKRNYFPAISNDGTENVSMDDSQINISRWESMRDQNKEVEIKINGFKDIIVLLPTSKLIYKP
jgi:hypothetical protein